MKILDFLSAILQKKEKHQKFDGFSDFYLNTSTDQKIRVFTEVAHKANQEQSRLFKEAKLKLKTN